MKRTSLWYLPAHSRESVTRRRRGSILILVASLLVVLLGVVAFAVDFGRMYLDRAQVHVSADAAALAGADRLLRLAPTRGADSAIRYGQLNLVENVAPTIGSADVVPGRWDFSRRTFTATGSWTAANTNAVRATSRYTAHYLFGRIYGFETKLRSATSIAAVGYASRTPCVRPMVVPYQAMLDMLFPPAGSQTSATHPSLDTTDVRRLAQLTIANEITLAGKGNGPLGSGTFGGVRLPPIQYADGSGGNPWNNASNNWEYGLGVTCDSLAQRIAAYGGRPTIGVGDQLAEDNGVTTSAQSAGIERLCNNEGGGTVPATPKNNATFSCVNPVPVKVAVSEALVSGRFTVKFIGVFAVTGYTKNTGIRGYFSSIASTGAFSGTPSPVKAIALVQ
ncbi:MAG: hypothetical protein K2R93_11575 [Gemmatimonadaceae bacterium]|nr:hypothetical protein [Gemmatimonadaceae bacterium]